MKRRVLLVFLAVLLVAAAIGVWRWRYLRSPGYALQQAARAAAAHDLTTFRKYVHTEELTARFVDDTLAVVTDQAKDNPLGGLAAGMVAMMRPQLVQAAQNALERGIEEGNFEPEKSNVGNPTREAVSYWRPASETTSGFRRVAYIREDGKVAAAGLEMYDAELQMPFVVELKLRDTGSHWQIVEIANLREVQKQLEEGTRKRLDTLNGPIRAELRKALAVQGDALRNASGKPIAKVEFSNGRVIDEVIPPNGTIAAWGEVTRIEFADGSSLQLLTRVPRE